MPILGYLATYYILELDGQLSVLYIHMQRPDSVLPNCGNCRTDLGMDAIFGRVFDGPTGLIDSDAKVDQVELRLGSREYMMDLFVNF